MKTVKDKFKIKKANKHNMLDRHGQAALEFTLIIPILILVILAVSQLCSMGCSVFVGPAPLYEAYKCHGRESFLCHNGDISPITLANGVYVIPVRELHKSPLAGNINGPGPCAAATPEQLVAEAAAGTAAPATGGHLIPTIL